MEPSEETKARRRGTRSNETPAPAAAAMESSSAAKTPQQAIRDSLSADPQLLRELAATVRKEVQDGLRSEYEQQLEQARQRFTDEKNELQRLVEAFKDKVKDASTHQYKDASPQPTGLGTPFQPQIKDVGYAQLLRQAEEAKKFVATASSQSPATDIAKAITDSLKAATGKSPVSGPAKWSGKDSGWLKFWGEFRAYAQAKDWLSTIEDPTGPGSPGAPNIHFDHKVNTAVYSKLLHLTSGGAATTWIRQAPEFDGWTAVQMLLKRFGGHSRQEVNIIRNTIETLKHAKGTCMAARIDLFESLIAKLENCHYSPTDDEKIDWLQRPISEATYSPTKAYVIGQQYDNSMTYQKLVSMLNNACWAQYPHFKMESILGKKATQRATKNTGGKYCWFHKTTPRGAPECLALKGKNQKGKGRGNNRGGNGRGRGRDKGKGGEEKGKGKGRAQNGRAARGKFLAAAAASGGCRKFLLGAGASQEISLGEPGARRQFLAPPLGALARGSGAWAP